MQKRSSTTGSWKLHPLLQFVLGPLLHLKGAPTNHVTVYSSRYPALGCLMCKWQGLCARESKSLGTQAGKGQFEPGGSKSVWQD